MANWSPSDLGANLAAWYDANVSGSVSVSGGFVTAWADQSGNSKNLTPTSSTNLVYSATSLSTSKPGITFDGSNGFTNSSFGIGSGVKISAFAAAQMNFSTIGSYGRLVSIAQTGQADFNGGSAGDIPLLREGNSARISTWGISPSVDQTTNVAFVTSGMNYGSSAENRVNGASQNIAGYTYGAFTADKLGIGYGVDGVGSAWGGVVSEVVVIKTDPTANITVGQGSFKIYEVIEGYLAWKWGTVSTLDAGHPFKSAAPTAASSGITGTFTGTEGADVAALAGKVAVKGTIAATEGADAAALTGKVAVRGTIAATEGADVGALAGKVAVRGTITATEGADTGSLSGTVLVQGTIAATEGADTASITGTVLVQGALAATEGADTSAWSGSATNDRTGTLAATEGADSASLTGTVLVQGTLGATEGADSSTWSGTTFPEPVVPPQEPNGAGLIEPRLNLPDWLKPRPFRPEPPPAPIVGSANSGQAAQSASGRMRPSVAAKAFSEEVHEQAAADIGMAIAAGVASAQFRQPSFGNANLNVRGSVNSKQGETECDVVLNVGIVFRAKSGGEQIVPTYDGGDCASESFVPMDQAPELVP